MVYNERDGRSGRGVVVQDINASTTICMQKIRDLESYPKVVPNLKKVQIYETKKFSNVRKAAMRSFLNLFSVARDYREQRRLRRDLILASLELKLPISCFALLNPNTTLSRGHWITDIIAISVKRPFDYHNFYCSHRFLINF